MEAEKQKLSYIAPEVKELGSFEDVTAGNSGGNALDASYPTNTPKEQLTFS